MKTGGSAFPIDPDLQSTGENDAPWRGMTLRDYFAGQALIGLLSGDRSILANAVNESNTDVYYAASVIAYKFADTMIQVRKDDEL